MDDCHLLGCGALVVDFINFNRVCKTFSRHILVCKPEHFMDDLRLNNPWPELRGYIVLF